MGVDTWLISIPCLWLYVIGVVVVDAVPSEIAAIRRKFLCFFSAMNYKLAKATLQELQALS
jgi:hypothetical protein